MADRLGAERLLLAGLENVVSARRRVRGWRGEALAARWRATGGRPEPSQGAARAAAEQALLERERAELVSARRGLADAAGDVGPLEQAFGVRLAVVDGVAVARRSSLADRRGRWTDEQISAEEQFRMMAAAAARIEALPGCLRQRSGARPDMLAQMLRRERMVSDWRRFRRVVAAVPVRQAQAAADSSLCSSSACRRNPTPGKQPHSAPWPRYR